MILSTIDVMGARKVVDGDKNPDFTLCFMEN